MLNATLQRRQVRSELEVERSPLLEVQFRTKYEVARYLLDL